MNTMSLSYLQEISHMLAQVPENNDAWTYTIHGPDGFDYLTRTLLPRVGDSRPVIHHIHRADRDRHLHNHPWETASFLIISGSYIEERLTGSMSGGQTQFYTRETGDVNVLTAGTFHRIHELRGDVWTFGILGRRVQDWGFLVDGQVIQHDRYWEQLQKERQP